MSGKEDVSMANTKTDKSGMEKSVDEKRANCCGEVESILEGIDQLKLSSIDDKDTNNNKNAELKNEENVECGNNRVRNSPKLEQSQVETTADDKKLGNSGSVSESDEDSKSDGGSPKGSQNIQAAAGGRMSPAEYFQTSRLRCSGLANKLNTTHNYGGSANLIDTNALGETTASRVEEIIKGVEKVVLDENADSKSQKLNNDNQNETVENAPEVVDKETEPELIDRSPMPVYANRYAHHPYQQSQHPYQQPQPQQQQQSRYSSYQAAPSRGYCHVNADDGWTYSPANYMEQQRNKAAAHCAAPRQMYQQPQQQMAPVQNYYGYDQRSNAVWPSTNCCQYQTPQMSAAPTGQPTGHPSPNMGQYVAISPSPYEQSITTAVDPGQLAATQSPLAVLSPFELSPMLPTDEANVGEIVAQKTIVDLKERNLGDGQQPSLTEMTIEELPDELCDFILTYSRYYTGKSGDVVSSERSKLQLRSGEHPSVEERETKNPSLHQSPCASGQPSPLLATDGSAGGEVFSPVPALCTYSPSAYSPRDGNEAKSPNVTSINESEEKQQLQPSSARQRLRERIDESELDAAWAWAMRCCQSKPEALFFRDQDGDSLLHIVIWHKDLAKVYVLTEIMLKNAVNARQSAPKPLDLSNKSNETPLFLAVEKGLADVVAYLLECGADPNVGVNYEDADLPLQYAAARGMSDIVETLCKSGRCHINNVNACGVTALLCAVKNHSNLEEESGTTVNNTLAIKALLKAGADPTIQDASNGKNVLHYCVERMDPALLQLFGDHLPRNVMARLVKTCDYNGYTPLSLLTGSVLPAGSCESDESKLRQKMSKLLLEFSIVEQLSADDFGDLTVLLSDQVSMDGFQFALFDKLISSEEAY